MGSWNWRQHRCSWPQRSSDRRNSGVGFYTSLAGPATAPNVVMACRDGMRSQKPFNEVSAAAAGEVELRTLDLADLDSVRNRG